MFTRPTRQKRVNRKDANGAPNSSDKSGISPGWSRCHAEARTELTARFRLLGSPAARTTIDLVAACVGARRRLSARHTAAAVASTKRPPTTPGYQRATQRHGQTQDHPPPCPLAQHALRKARPVPTESPANYSRASSRPLTFVSFPDPVASVGDRGRPGTRPKTSQLAHRSSRRQPASWCRSIFTLFVVPVFYSLIATQHQPQEEEVEDLPLGVERSPA